MLDKSLISAGGLVPIYGKSIAVTWPTTAGGTPFFGTFQSTIGKSGTRADGSPVWPEKAIVCAFTVRAFPCTMSFDGAAPTAHTVGHDYAVPASQAPYILPFGQKVMENTLVIGDGGSATAYITFYKLADRD